jgi:demethylmenaquinone methyltransferase / 2-methoxy-6-polyprenyl-1,4-benzoquinol methylase
MLQRQRGLLGRLDSRRILGQAHLGELAAQALEIATGGQIGGQLAHHDDRRDLAYELPSVRRLACVVHDEPGARLLVAEGHEVRTGAARRLGRQDAADRASVGGEPGDPLQVFGQLHAFQPRLDVVERSEHAKHLFAPLGPTYDRVGATLSFGQDPRWRRYLVSRVDAGPGDRVLDVATGTGLVAQELVHTKGCAVVGVDQSAGMLDAARHRLDAGVELVEASAESLPFANDEFDALTFTYLLRYVEDPAATLRELARVVRPGGTIAGLEFGVPHGAWRPLWELYTRIGLPAAGAAVGRGWREACSFLGPSIRGFYKRLPGERLLELWRESGIVDVHMQRLSVGGGIVTWGRKK